MKGKKLCTSCGDFIAARANKCSCGFEFINSIKNRLKKKDVQKSKSVDWTTLKKGDVVKIKKGGPRWITQDGKEVALFDRGIFKVSFLTDDGFHAYGEEGHTFIYCGPAKLSKYGTKLVPHKVYIYGNS